MTHHGYLVGLIGAGITKSLTPALHEAEAAALGLTYEYRILDLVELGKPPSAVGSMLAQAQNDGYAAVNITHPCKQLVLDVVDELDMHAEQLRAVNLVVFRDGRAIGYNTDWMGFRDAVASGLPGASLERIVQIGCGGAGAATAYALLASGAARLDLFDADEARATELAVRMRQWFPDARIAAVSRLALPVMILSAAGVVHATPLGMLDHPGVAFDVELLSAGAWVSDVVYRPLRTALIRAAEARGHAVLDGGRMAVGQAYASLQIICGEQPDRPRMERHFQSLVGAE